MKLLLVLAAIIACSYGQDVSTEFTDPCAEVDVNYQGSDLQLVLNIKDWRECALRCKKVPVCKVFTYVKSTGCCYMKESAAASNPKRGIGSISGPQGCGLYPTENEIACEGQSASISCGKGMVIKAVASNYGRLTKSICPARQMRNLKCETPNALSTVKSLCDGKQSCDVGATNAVFGEPCRNTAKYLSVSFQCIPIPIAVTAEDGYDAVPQLGGFCYFEKKFKPLRNNLVGTIPTLGKSYEISFEFYPVTSGNSWTSLIHLTLGENMRRYGDRSPGIFLRSADGQTIERFHTCAAINGNRVACYSFMGGVPLNKWYQVYINQKLVGTDYVYSIFLNGQLIKSWTNNQPAVFKNVKIFAADPWYPASNAWIRNLCVGAI